MNEREALRDAFAKNPKAAIRLAEMIEAGKLKFDTPDENEELHVICMPWPGMFDGCTHEPCATCGADLAVAHSTREMVANQKVPPFFQCVTCATLPSH